MESLKKQYEDIIAERKKVVEQINVLEENEFVKKYFELCSLNDELINQQNNLYTRMKENEQHASCTHIWVYSHIDYDSCEDCSYYVVGCIKCGLDQRILQAKDLDLLTLDERIRYGFDQNPNCLNGIYSNVLCDLDLAKAIYSKIKKVYPDIDDEVARKYFEIALDNIRNIKVNEDRKISRARRLSLSPKFSNWGSRYDQDF